MRLVFRRRWLVVHVNENDGKRMISVDMSSAEFERSDLTAAFRNGNPVQYDIASSLLQSCLLCRCFGHGIITPLLRRMPGSHLLRHSLRR